MTDEEGGGASSFVTVELVADEKPVLEEGLE